MPDRERISTASGRGSVPEAASAIRLHSLISRIPAHTANTLGTESYLPESDALVVRAPSCILITPDRTRERPPFLLFVVAFLAIIVASPRTAAAQQLDVIRGQVTGADDDEPIENANVTATSVAAA